MTSAISEDLLESLRGAAPRNGRPYLMPVPDCEPPYDELPPAPAAFRPAWLEQAISEPDARPASAASGDGQRSRPLNPALSGAHPGTITPVASSVAPDQAPAVQSTVPAARSVAGAAARILIEALCGARPVRQLAGTCAPPVLTTLGRQVRVGGSIPRLMSVHVSEPAARVAEVSAVYRDRDRVAALAFRLEAIGARWRVTQLQLA